MKKINFFWCVFVVIKLISPAVLASSIAIPATNIKAVKEAELVISGEIIGDGMVHTWDMEAVDTNGETTFVPETVTVREFLVSEVLAGTGVEPGSIVKIHVGRHSNLKDIDSGRQHTLSLQEDFESKQSGNRGYLIQNPRPILAPESMELKSWVNHIRTVDDSIIYDLVVGELLENGVDLEKLRGGALESDDHEEYEYPYNPEYEEDRVAEVFDAPTDLPDDKVGDDSDQNILHDDDGKASSLNRKRKNNSTAKLSSLSAKDIEKVTAVAQSKAGQIAAAKNGSLVERDKNNSSSFIAIVLLLGALGSVGLYYLVMSIRR